MTKFLKSFLLLLIATTFSALSFAEPLSGFSDRVVMTGGGIYPDSDVTLNEGNETVIFVGGSPIFGGDGWGVLNIFLTEAGTNTISDHLFSLPGAQHQCDIASGSGADCIFFASDPAADPLIGTPCVLGPAFCREEDGTLQNVTDMVALQNGGLGIFGGGQIFIQSDIPEPMSLALLGLGLAGLGFSRRKAAR